MPLRVLIAPDKFKGTLTATAAARAIAAGWRQARPKDRLTLLPISDGGDGFGELLGLALGAKVQTVRTVDAAHRPIRGRWWWHASSRTAIIESAKIIGLAMLPPGKFHPFDLDTFGLGAVLQAAAKKGAKRCLIGIGGSATNDGGFGVARALGWQFLNAQAQPITRWTELHRLKSLELPTDGPAFEEVIVAVDVQNPLLGPRGCSRVYGPQKGLRPEDYPIADAALGALAKTVRQLWATDIAREPGTGAAGGLGFGLRAFAGAQLAPGFDLFAGQTRLAAQLKRADLVITGEGSIDQSSLMGKGVGELAQMTAGAELPCIGLAGVLGQRQKLTGLFVHTGCLTPDLTTPESAKTKPALWLRRLARETAEAWSARR